MTTLSKAAFGDDEALSALVRAYHDRVYRFGVQVCRDPADADDAVQEAFIKLARRPDVIEAPSALSWLMSVVRRTCLRMLRPFHQQLRALGVPDVLHTTPSEALDPEGALLRFERVTQVHAAIAQLNVEQRAVLVLRDLEERSAEETCAMLGLSEAAMKSRLHRARQSLRASLAEKQAT